MHAEGKSDETAAPKYFSRGPYLRQFIEELDSKAKDGAPMVCEILVALQGRVDAARLFGDRLEQIIFKLGGTRSTWDPKTGGKSQTVRVVKNEL